MIDSLRKRLSDALHSTKGDRVPGVKLGKSVARIADDLLGNPLAKAPQPAVATASPRPAPRRREPAPVTLYVEWDSPARDEVEQLLRENEVPFKVLAVDRDEATKAFLAQTAKREAPVLFIATDPVGWIDELRELHASGELRTRVFGSA